MNLIKIALIPVIAFWACTSDSASQEGQEQAENTITLSGTVGYPQQNGLILLERFDGNTPVPFDTIRLSENYTFEEQVNVAAPGYYRLNFYNKQMVPLILGRDDVEVTVDGNNQQGYVNVAGSRDHDFINEVQQMAQQFQASDAVKDINSRFMAANGAGDQEAMESLRGEYQELEKEFKNEIKAKIDSIGPSLGVVEVLRGGRYLDKDRDFETYKNYAQLLQKEIPGSAVAQDFVKEVEQMGKLAIGQVAPDIALPNPDGEVIKLSSLRGNYVLVDFWAKWCKPCRMENPNVVRMYKKYNDKGFEVYGVSLDRKREDWIQAIEEDQLHWTQVSDLKFWNSEAARLYNVNSIPFALLLDPEGVIIGKNLRGKELENKLEEIFGGR